MSGKHRTTITKLKTNERLRKIASTYAVEYLIDFHLTDSLH